MRESLLFVFAGGLIFWLGGATTLQILLARVRLNGDYQQAIILMGQTMWIIPRLFVPASLAAFFAGVGLLLATGTSFLAAWVLFPIAVYVATVIVGASFSLPEYRKLAKMSAERGDGDAGVLRRLDRVALVNRIELVLVFVALIGVVTQPAI